MRNDCHSFQDWIADLVTGILPEREHRELEEHLASCADCRAYLQALKQEDALLTKHFAGIDEDMVGRQERMLQRVRCSYMNEKRKRISIWREIMKSPFSKLATAAAVVVIAAVTLIVLDRSATPVYALGDVATAFDQARVIHVEGWQYFPRLKHNDGSVIAPVPINSWIDLENGRMRQTYVSLAQRGRLSLSGVPDVNTTVTVGEMVFNGPCLMILDHTAKTAVFARMTDYYRQWMTYQKSRLLWGQLCSQPAQLEHFVKVGQDEIDGHPHDIWQLDAANGMGGLVGGGAGGGGGGSSNGNGSGEGHFAPVIPSLQSRLWISADTGRLGRAQVLSQTGAGHWELEQDYRTIDYDVPIPESTFAEEPPAGYTALNSKETAQFVPLPSATVACGRVQCRTLVSFTLSDGSVIVAWQSFVQGAEQPQEPLFADLSFGGPLPKLPVEIYSLKPAGAPDRTAYVGRHLGYTSKAGGLVEWALYVPKTALPANVKYLGYDVLWRFNVASPNGGMGLTVAYGVPLRTAEDFDKWVRGAMAEFSDSGRPPADVTYQKVCDLAQQVRTPIKP
jgi:hypothetical protein